MWLRGMVAALVVAGALAGVAPVRAQEQGYWRASSSMASTITGDITIGKGKLTIDFYTYPMAPIRTLKPTEVSAVFDADVRAGINGMLYRVKIPGAQRFNKKNTLCGDEDTQWMATYVTGKTLQVAFFSGDDQPVFTFDAMQNNPALCGSFEYGR